MAEFFWPPKTATDPDAVTDGTNLGTGSEIFAGKNGNNLEFKTLVAGSNVTLDETANTITINSTGGGGSGAVFGPGSSTDNAITRWDGVGGTNVQDSIVTISDTGTISGAESLSLSLLTASRAIVTDGSKNLVSTTTTAAEIGFVNGVTSAIQTQLNAKQATGNYITATTGDVVATGPGSVAATIQADAVTTTKILNSAVTDAKIAAGVDAVKIANGSVSNTEFQYLDGVTSAIQTQLDAKQPTGNYISALTGEVTATGPGGVAATVTNSAVIGKVLTGYVAAAGTVAATDTILQGMQKLDGNNALKVSKAGDSMTGDLVFATTKGIQVPLNSELRIGTLNNGASITVGNGTSSMDFNAGKFQVLTTGTYTDGTSTFTNTMTIDNEKSIRFVENNVNGADYIALKAPASVTANTTLTLPNGTGTAGQYITTNGSGGIMSWATLTPPTVQKFTTGSSTYTTPANVKWLRVTAVGGGGGGAGGGTASSGATGSTGGSTTFGTTLITCNGGAGGSNINNGGAGGTASAVGLTGVILSGGYGTTGMNIANGTGGGGGNSPFGGAGRGAAGGAGNAGVAAVANSGSGGGAGASTGGSPGGGGTGGYVSVIITAPLSSYTYVVGVGGVGGTAGTTGGAGGDGGSGLIVIEEYYQ